MNDITLKLVDTGSIFHDISQGRTVTGSDEVKFRRTDKVKKALKNGVVVEVKAKSNKVTAPEDLGDNGSENYSDLKKAELQSLLDERGLTYNEKATNSELVSILENN